MAPCTIWMSWIRAVRFLRVQSAKHGVVHVREQGIQVEEDDLVYVDHHGVRVISEGVIPELEGAIRTVMSNEMFVLAPAANPVLPLIS